MKKNSFYLFRSDFCYEKKKRTENVDEIPSEIDKRKNFENFFWSWIERKKFKNRNEVGG